MKLHGLTVCVDFADLFAYSIERWAKGLDSLTVVTTPSDTATIDLCNQHGADIWTTDAFYRDGAAFDKGRAMEEARQSMPWRDWCLFFDCDIYPEPCWRHVIETYKPTPGNLYSAPRRECPNPANRDAKHLPNVPGDGLGVGYFQLFHTSDERVQQTPLLGSWHNASGVDNEFKARWPDELIRCLPLTLTHLGERRQWCGRGNDAGMAAMEAERVKRKGWQHERRDHLSRSFGVQDV